MNPLRILNSVRTSSPSRWCSSFVSRMRFISRLKEDDEACAAALENGSVLLFHRLDPLLHRTRTGTFTTGSHSSSVVQVILEQLDADIALLAESVLIGCSEQNQAQFCLDVASLDRVTIQGTCSGKFVDLRKSFFLLPESEAPLVAKAQALLRWHQTHGFCSATGQPTERNRAGSHRVCKSSGTVYYPQMSPVVLVLVSDGKRCLLGRQSSFPQGMYSALAGFCDMGETVEETVCREVAEEVGLEVVGVSYSSSQHWPFPHSSFMIGCHALVSPADTQLTVDRSELEDARWFTLEEISFALQAKTPPRKGDPPITWLPPRHALAHRIITEWAELQHCREAGQ